MHLLKMAIERRSKWRATSKLNSRGDHGERSRDSEVERREEQSEVETAKSRQQSPDSEVERREEQSEVERREEQSEETAKSRGEEQSEREEQSEEREERGAEGYISVIKCTRASAKRTG
ncbi:hypothetical protein Sjap_010995 [Stephania japonica]|uniref:Uncharacterized protein n=1 Tax=Stephania japonica TaxID=461633 RepID=A0AAP0P4N2_9MAGN